MLLSKFIEHRGRHCMFVCKGFIVGIWKIFFIERQARLIDRGLRLLQIGLRALHDFFHRQVRRECETQLLPKLVRTESKIAVRAWKQIVLEPFLVIFQRCCGFFLQRRQLLLHLRRAIENRRESFAHEIDGALRLLDGCLCVNAWWVLEIGFCLSDHAGNSFHPLA